MAVLDLSRAERFDKFYESLPFSSFTPVTSPYDIALRYKKGAPAKVFSVAEHAKDLLPLVEIRDLLYKKKDVYVIPLEIPTTRIGFMFRSKETKEFRVIPYSRFFAFGFESFADFQYGMPIFLVEGPKDAIVAKAFYKYSVAYLTQSPSPILLKVFAKMTKTLVMIPDTDKAGMEGAEYVKQHFEGNVVVKFPPYKDLGTFFDAEYSRVHIKQFMQNLVGEIQNDRQSL